MDVPGAECVSIINYKLQGNVHSIKETAWLSDKTLTCNQDAQVSSLPLSLPQLDL